MKRVAAVFSVFVTSVVFGQTLPNYYDTLPQGQEISVYGAMDYSASSIYSEMSNKFYLGGVLTGEMIDRSLSKHKAVNRIGFDGTGELIYRNYNPIVKKYNLGYQITAGAYYFGGALYSKDLFDVAFNGNADIKGDTADFSGTKFAFTSFQKIGFGLVSNKNRSSLSLNIYNIQNRIDFDLRKAQMIQSDAIDTITLVGNGSLSLPSNKEFNQGIGVGLDFTYYMPVVFKEGKTSFIEFQIKNLGVGYMYQDQKYYQFDTTLTYSGFRFDELFGDKAINFDSLNVLDTVGVVSSVRNNTFLLPGFLQVSKIVDQYSSSKFQSFFGVRLYPTLNYSPFVFAGLDYKINDWLRCGINASYGGFSKFKGGLYFNAKLNKINIGIGSENISGFVSRKGSGISANCRISCAF